MPTYEAALAAYHDQAHKQRDIHDAATDFINASYDRERYLYQRHLRSLFGDQWNKELDERRVAQLDRAGTS
jgi:ABC-type sulfate transport system substrate-binding protein